MTSTVRHTPALLGLVFLLCAPLASHGQTFATSVGRSPRGIDEVRTASNAWQRRLGPDRRVVDQVCLVPDFATFLEAVATWDERHYYPILIDDIELNFKFLRAFQPARIVRFPRKSPAIPADQVWTRAVETVGGAWSDAPAQGAKALPGDAVPRTLGETPPGVVLSEPDSPMLAGAIALAAGRFQPLLRWDVEKRYGDVLSNEEALSLASSLEARVSTLLPDHSRMGDDCDFLTLAGDWPYRYDTKAGPKAFDDLAGRVAGGRVRWAYAGRLNGEAPASVYRAMCSLFLQPRSALLFNAYDEKDRAWSAYSMRTASRRLARSLPVTHRSGDRANVNGWHQAFDPVNRSGLVLINSHGEPNRFGLVGGYGLVGDIPQTEPAVVAMIHSFSAAEPVDPNTVAGRWLANGAFVFYGSMHEPFLGAFRTPDLVAELVDGGIPLVAALRQSAYEQHGDPWKLVYFGDPLYRLNRGEPAPRLAPQDWATGAAWPRYQSSARPAATATDDARLGWAVKTAVAQLQRDPGAETRESLIEVLTAIRRSRLEAGLTAYYEALLGDTLLQANRPGELNALLAAIPPADRSPAVKRLLETCQFILLDYYLKRREFVRAERAWGELMHSGLPRDILEQITGRMAPLADSPSHRAAWRAMLIATGRQLKDTPAEAVIETERTRIERMR